MPEIHDAFRVSDLYSNEEIYKSLGVGNAGGVRVRKTANGDVERLVIFSSKPTARQLAENPYCDRTEGNVLVYTGAGKEGDQAAGGVNARILQQQRTPFPIYGFVQVASRRDTSVGAKRWEFLGLLQCLRSFQERQIDRRGEWRNAWVFELFIHSEPSVVHTKEDANLMQEAISRHTRDEPAADSDVVTSQMLAESSIDLSRIEQIRRQMLSFEPRRFELVIEDLLVQSGFEHVEVTKYSQDGGIDVNARPGQLCWPMRHVLLQLQAKRWLHTVGRKEVAELRGSLQPHAAGCIVTTSHFSRAALIESSAPGKVPIRAIDGIELASVVASLDLKLP